MSDANPIERRRTERRTRRVSLHWPERRRGFERRMASPGRRRYQHALTRYGGHPWLLITVLTAVVALNGVDLVLTVHLLHGGAVELNPIMARMLDVDVALAAAVKVTLGVAVVAVLWMLRRYRRALEASVVILALLVAVVAYQTGGIVLID